MPLGVADKKYFGLAKGFNTEAPLTQFPEGFTLDEYNFDLLQDGSRRRRPPIDTERNYVLGDPYITTGVAVDSAITAGIWNAVNNDSSLNFVVIQVGYMLLFYHKPDAGHPITENPVTFSGIDLREFRVAIESPAYEATDEDIRKWPVDLTFGQGRMFVVGKHTEPFFVEYNATTGLFDTERIVVQERDFIGIEDGIAIAVQPGELTQTHDYNLRNRGWLPGNILQYFTDKDVYPSKTQIQWRGMVRLDPTGFNPDDGIKQFSSDKLFSELFQDSSAPQGHLRLDTFDTRLAYDSSNVQTSALFEDLIDITNAPGEFYDLTLKSTAHGLADGATIDVVGLTIIWFDAFGKAQKNIYNGPYVIDLVSVDEFKIRVKRSGSFGIAVLKGGSWAESGTSGEAVYIVRSTDDADALKYRFTSVEYFAGRVWYAGALDHRLGNKLYFSVISEDPKKSGRCYQEADPTSEFISELVPTDGGVIVIPAMQDVLALATFGHYLLVFARNGVWQVGPGELGIFSPTSYSVRKVSDAGCIARKSVSVSEDFPVYWSHDGIYALSQDQNSGFLVAQNITRDTINSMYLSIPIEHRADAQVVYDLYRKRLMWFFSPQQPVPTAVPPAVGDDEPSPGPLSPVFFQQDAVERLGYTHVLLFDLRLQAWTKWALHTGNNFYVIREAFILNNDYIENDDVRVKLLVIQNTPPTSPLMVKEFNSTPLTYGDFNSPSLLAVAYIATGPDSLGEPAKFKYAPIVNVFFKRVEGALLQMQGRWDWARGSTSGKMTNFFNVYREDARPNQEAFAMVVTRNKLPGRGRNVFLFFRTVNDKNVWLDGYTINYEALMKE